MLDTTSVSEPALIMSEKNMEPNTMSMVIWVDTIIHHTVPSQLTYCHEEHSRAILNGSHAICEPEETPLDQEKDK